MQKYRIVVLGTVASAPYAGMAWMHMQIAAGLRMLGHDVWYMEVTSAWPYDPVRASPTDDSTYSINYLRSVAEEFGLGERWALRRNYADRQWLGPARVLAEQLLADADLVINVSGATDLALEGIHPRRALYLGTDPVYDEIAYHDNDPVTCKLVDQHDDVMTYGENIGNPDCPLPPLPKLRGRTRQPVLLDRWRTESSPRDVFTTVTNWKIDGYDIDFRGQTYFWSKHREFQKIIDLPHKTAQPIELAMGLKQLSTDVPAMLRSYGWRLADAHEFTLRPGPYRDYVCASRGEFTVAKDQNVRLRSGWFSERSACYLAAGRPVITQDTAFACALPTGQGLFAFNTMDDILAAFDAINSDYAKHSRAALRIADEFFRAETVLSRLLGDLGM
jgi:hypothetical protein